MACARLKFLGDAFELASLGVKESYQGRGVGTAIVRACLEAADGHVFCLTEKAAFFGRLGFREAPPDDVPSELRKKMRERCPGTTNVMVHGGNPRA